MFITKHFFRLILITLFLTLPVCFMNCKKTTEHQSAAFESFINIPGITTEEIAAINELKNEYNKFVFSVLPSTTAFLDSSGEIGGFFALFCDWLTGLFGISFVPEYVEWNDFLAKLASFEVDFTGAMTPTEERLKTYYMTSPIAMQIIKSYQITGSESIENITQRRLPRYAFILDTSIINDIAAAVGSDTFETILVRSTDEAYEFLKTGQADAFLYSDAVEVSFDKFGDVTAKDFFPLIYNPVSLATQNPKLNPIITAVQKALDNGAHSSLTTIYNQGHKEYQRNKLRNQFTEEEREYIRNNPVIPVGAIYSNYPVSFFNNRENEFQGIFFDLLDEIESMTGLVFKLANDQYTEWGTIQEMLRNKEVFFVSDMIWTRAREEYFIWSETSIHNDSYALISKLDFPNVSTNEILNSKIGLTRETAYTAMFKQWFPGHENTIEYNGIEETFNAMRNNKVDMVMTTERRLMFLTHYQELSGYKVNYVFNQSISTRFGFNKDGEVLRSIIDKALNTIDTEGISNQWMRKTFDYRAKVLEAQRPLLYGSLVLGACVISLLVILFIRSRYTGKQLEALVKEKTRDLADSYNYAQKAREEAEHANRAKSSFLANMSHEIRTPMNAIMGVTDILMQNEKLPSEIEDGLEMIFASSEMLLGIINDILDFSKIEAGKLDIIPAPYQVASMINDAVHLNMMRIGNRPIQFELKIDESIPAELIGDELRIKQILNNALSNAFKYTDSGKVTMSISAKSDRGGKNTTLVFCIQDTGHGMTNEQLKRLFEEYSRFSENTKRTIEGTGLGFSIMQRLVNLMNGSINVESEPDRGTSVTVQLPQIIAEGSAMLGQDIIDNLRRFQINNIVHKRNIRFKREPMPYGRVLIVDDTETNLFVAERLMRLYKLQIETAVNGREAVDKITNGNTYDIIFMDHMMPEMDGIEATKKIREWEAEQNAKIKSKSFTADESMESPKETQSNNGKPHMRTPIVALTANAVVGQADVFLKNGFDAFISKPLDINQLDITLNKMIRDKQPPEVIEAARREQAAEQDIPAEQTDTEPLLLESFIRDAQKAVTLLKELIKDSAYKNNDNLQKYITCVHGMGSSLLAVNEKELSGKARRLEQAGRDKDFDLISASSPELINDLCLLLEKIKPAHKEETTDDNIEELLKILPALIEKLSDYNRKGSLDILTGIKNCSSKTRSIITEITEYIMHSEFEKGENAAAEYLDVIKRRKSI
ncbi:MAG: ATP-binding protein [Treponema sp.]|nr:ATP-binding protein [Treponema sp.]